MNDRYQKGDVNSGDNKNLEALIGEAREGNTDAFRAIFNEYIDRLYGYAISRTANKQEALDVVQETFVDLWRALEKFEYRSDEAFGGFVFKILKRKIARTHRMRRSDISLDALDFEEGYEVEIEDYRFVMDGVDSLSPMYREVIRLRYWSGLTFGEIAGILDINEGTAKIRHHRAIKKLKDKLDKDEGFRE